MKTMYDIIREKLIQRRIELDEKSVEEYENFLQAMSLRELKDIIIEYDEAEMLANINYQTIKFISYAEDGACGSAGEMYIITKCVNEVKVYCFDCKNEVPIEKFQLLLPWFCPFLKKITNYRLHSKMNQIEINGWKYCYLGLGNHLFISDDIYPFFIDENISFLMNTCQHSKLYACWKNKAEDVLDAKI